jgi:hypothetical protein
MTRPRPAIVQQEVDAALAALGGRCRRCGATAAFEVLRFRLTAGASAGPVTFVGKSHDAIFDAARQVLVSLAADPYSVVLLCPKCQDFYDTFSEARNAADV